MVASQALRQARGDGVWGLRVSRCGVGRTVLPSMHGQSLIPCQAASPLHSPQSTIEGAGNPIRRLWNALREPKRWPQYDTQAPDPALLFYTAERQDCLKGVRRDMLFDDKTLEL